MPYLCTRNTTTGCSAVRLAHLVWDQRVPGSNPGIPTERQRKLSLFLFPRRLLQVIPKWLCSRSIQKQKDVGFRHLLASFA